MVEDVKWCTEKCIYCRQVSLINSCETHICISDGIEVIPIEIDLTPGVGQIAPYVNTVCEHVPRLPADTSSRSELEIRTKIDEIEARIHQERIVEIATRAACERDALEWALGEDMALHDMATLEFKPDGTYVKVPWDGKS